ncbi:MAG: hypothetical protein ACT4NY_09015 [Pseudonocardiales bacterium]
MATRVISTVDPWFIADRLSAPEARAFIGGMTPSAPGQSLAVEGGVIPNSGNAALAVTSVGTTSAPKVSVAPGRCVVPTSFYPYGCVWPTADQLDLALSPTNPRIDLIVARVLSAEHGDTDTGFYIDVVPGSPSGAPTAPATPINAIPLAESRVNTDGSVVITDRRHWTRAVGGVRYAAGDEARAGSHPGDLRIAASGQLDAWLATTSTWLTIASPSAWNQFAPVLSYRGGAGGTVNLGSQGSAVGRYIQLGKMLFLRYVFNASGTGIGAGSGAIYTRLPPGFLSSTVEQNRLLAWLLVTSPLSSWAGQAEIYANSNEINIDFPLSASDCRLNRYTVATSPGAAGTGTPYISGGFPDPNRLTIEGFIEVQ